MVWSFQSLNHEMQSLKIDIDRCYESIDIAKQTIQEMEDDLKRCAYNYLREVDTNCLESCNGCGKDDDGVIWGVRFIKEAKADIKRYNKILKWKKEVLETMKAQSKALRFVS